MATKKFKPIELYTNTPEDIFQTYKPEISKAIIEAIAYGSRYKRKKVDFARVIIKDSLVITLTIDSREFLDLIDDNLNNLIEAEEYEVCALAVKLKKKLLPNYAETK